MPGEDETSNDRGWMYSGWKRGKSTDEWYENTKEFLDFAFSAQANVVQNGKIKCPCADCRNYIMKDRDAVELDLCDFGFKRNYNVWTEHGEGRVHLTDHVGANVDDNDRMDDMATDLAASNPPVGEEPIESAKAFYRMVDSVKELVHENTCSQEYLTSQYIKGRLEWCKDAEAWESLSKYWCSQEYLTSRGRGQLSRTSSVDDVAQNRGGSRNFICTKEYIGKTCGTEEATNMNTYKFMKVGAKKYKVSGSNTSIENTKAKKRLDDYEKGLKRAYPEDWQERDLDPAVMYSTGGGMPHGRLPIGNGAFRKSQVVAAAKRSNITPSNSMSYHDLLRRNTFLEKKNKNYAKHMRFFYTNAGFPVPEDLQDDLIEDSAHVNQSSPLTENGGTPLTASSRAGEQSDTPPSSQNRTTREDSPILDE